MFEAGMKVVMIDRGRRTIRTIKKVGKKIITLENELSRYRQDGIEVGNDIMHRNKILPLTQELEDEIKKEINLRKYQFTLCNVNWYELEDYEFLETVFLLNEKRKEKLCKNTSST